MKWEKKQSKKIIYENVSVGHTNIIYCSLYSVGPQVIVWLISCIQEILHCFLFYFHSIFGILKSFNLSIRNKMKKFNCPSWFIIAAPKKFGCKK